MITDMAKAKSVFLKAIEEHEPEQWSNFLDVACAGDDSLREQVEKLLKAHSRLGTYHGKSDNDVASTIDLPTAEQPGTMIGPYKLREEIGSGGMGTVFMATQKEPVRRKVALKVIKPGMDSKQVITRFEAERQALAMMDHPNIAKVHDGGTTESGRPYFVMELVKGIPITDYCDRYRLTTNQRLEVFGNVCSAVHHAHQKGIIHRDLKPSNILVTQLDGRAIPKVIDFGIAKAVSGHLTDDSLVTAHAQTVGTPLYMSPEQTDVSATDVDTRSDVYSLGVLLYELLTGTTPFDRERMSRVSFDEFRQIIREEDPPRPSTRLSTLDAAIETVADNRHTDPRTLSSQVSGELDWIVMKSLEKDRTRRYESANELAKDVRRYLNDEPVEACPPTAAYRLKKYARRNKTVLAFVASIALTLIVGAGVATWQAIVATDAKNLATERLLELDDQKGRAERHFQHAMDAVDEMLTDVADEDLADIPHMATVREKLLNKALAFYQALQAEECDDPAAQVETARARKRCGDIYRLLGKHEAAEKAFRESIRQFETIQVQGADHAAIQNDLAGSLSALASLHDSMGHHELATQLSNRAQSIVRGLLNQSPKNAEYLGTFSKVLSTLGTSLFQLGRRDEAEKAYREAIEAARQTLTASPNDAVRRLRLADILEHLGELQAVAGRHTDAITTCRELLAVTEQLVADFPESAEYRSRHATSHGLLGFALEGIGLTEEAEKNDRQAVESYKQLVADYPEVPDHRRSLAMYLGNLAALLAASGRSGDADRLSREALVIREQLAADYPEVPRWRVELAVSHNNVANLLRRTGHNEDAVKSYREAITIMEQLAIDYPEVPEHRLELATFHDNLAEVLKETGHGGDAEASCREALRIGEQLAADFPDDAHYRECVAWSHACLASLLETMGRFQEAETSCRKALAFYKPLSADFPHVPGYRSRWAKCLNLLASLLRREGEPDDAEASDREALSIQEQLAADYPDVPAHRDNLAISQYGLAIAQDSMGRHESADASYREALAIRHQLATENPEIPRYRLNLALCYAGFAVFLKNAGQPEGAEKSCREAVRVLEELVADFPEVPDYRRELGRALYNQGVLTRTELGNEKEEAYRKSIKISEKVVAEHPDDWAAISVLGMALNNLASLLKKTGQLKEVERLYLRKIEVNEARVRQFPENADYRKYLATTRRSLESVRREIATKTVKESPDDAEAHYRLGTYYAADGQYAEAVAEFDEAIRLDPSNALIYVERARAYLATGDINQASADCEKAIQLDSDVPMAYSTRAIVLGRQGEAETAAADWDRALSLSENDSRIYADRARSCTESGDFDAAIANFTKVMELTNEDAHLLIDRGFAYAASGDQTKAVADWRRAKQLDASCVNQIEFQLLGLSLRPIAADDNSHEEFAPRRALPWITGTTSDEQLVVAASFIAPDQAQRMTPVNKGDGKFTQEEMGGVPALVAERAYLYFNIDDEVMNELTGDAPVLVRVTALDTKRQTLRVNYDGQDAGENIGNEGRYCGTNKYSMTGSGRQWCYDFLLRQPRFANRQNNGSDFRICVGHISGGERQLVLHKVEVLTVDAQVVRYYDEVMRQIDDNEHSPNQPRDEAQTEQEEGIKREQLNQERTPDEDQSANYRSSPGWTSSERLGLRAPEDDWSYSNSQTGNDERRSLSC